jgi:hypothetical protein
LRAKPVEYTARIRHYVEANQWMMSVQIEGAGEDDENKRRVADDLRRAAVIIEDSI